MRDDLPEGGLKYKYSRVAPQKWRPQKKKKPSSLLGDTSIVQVHNCTYVHTYIINR